ncbi:hypothetical protein [Caballeronia sp. SBC1]|uniref:hypothetical protein n=1 Tax=Caballeronia sp. SBC1 TaxID=2705548 RepID=UPI001A9DFAF8|nr:hypothetical protein [Caballeronia sp. SBC1]
MPPVAVTPTVLSAFWRQRMGELFPAETVLFDTKTMGQLAVFIRKIGEDRALPAVAFALKNWADFRYKANLELTGLEVAPRVPAIGFMLRHRAILISVMDACD